MRMPVVLGVLLVVGVVSGAPAAQARTVQCDGVLTGHIDGNVVVPEGAQCTLVVADISGNVDVSRGASLHVQSSQIQGNIDADRPRLIAFANVVVGGNSKVVGESTSDCFWTATHYESMGSAGWKTCVAKLSLGSLAGIGCFADSDCEVSGSTSGGSAKCDDARCVFTDAEIQRRLTCAGSSCRVTGGSIGSQYSCLDAPICAASDTTIGSFHCNDSAECRLTRTFVRESGSCVQVDLCEIELSNVRLNFHAFLFDRVVFLFNIAADLQIGIAGVSTMPRASVAVQGNDIATDLVIMNVVADQIGVDQNRVGRNLALLHNTGPSHIIGNVVGGVLTALNNDPPPQCAGNTATEFKGQCTA